MKLCKTGRRIVGALLKVACVLACAALLAGLTVVIINAAMKDAASDMIFDVSEIDGQGVDCVLILGAGLKADGTPSHMLEDRIKVGVEVADAAGIRYILMSGDDSGDYYDEPSAMKKYAMELGVEESRILIDGQGFSTFESITRAGEVYGFDSIVIITQEYHLYRALHIADRYDIEAVGVSADLRPYVMQIKCDVREIFARVKDFYQCK